MLLKWKARPYPSSRRCATKVFRRAFQQKSGSAPVTPFFQWAVIIPFHFSVRYKQKVQEFFLSAPKSCMHTTSHPGSGFQSNTPGAPLAHGAFLNVLIQDRLSMGAWLCLLGALLVVSPLLISTNPSHKIFPGVPLKLG